MQYPMPKHPPTLVIEEWGGHCENILLNDVMNWVWQHYSALHPPQNMENAASSVREGKKVVCCNFIFFLFSHHRALLPPFFSFIKIAKREYYKKSVESSETCVCIFRRVATFPGALANTYSRLENAHVIKLAISQTLLHLKYSRYCVAKDQKNAACKFYSAFKEILLFYHDE